MNYVGVDLHKMTSWFYVLDEDGNKLDSRNLANDRESLKSYLETIPQPFILAVEATYNWGFMVDVASLYAEKVLLADSYALKAFAKRHKKTDKIDAKLIAEILQKGFLPTVTIADPETRQIRELLRYRIKLVTDRSRNIFRLKALLDNLGACARGNFATYKGLRQISLETIPEGYRGVAQGYIEQIESLSRRIFDLGKILEKQADSDRDIQHLMTIPGLSHFSASLVKSEIIAIDRFKSFNRLCAYAGLAPRVSNSGQRICHGPLNTNRRKHLQWILLETAIHFARGIPAKARRFHDLCRKKGFQTAKVMMARDMLKAIYHVLKERRDFLLNFPIQSVAAVAL